MIDERRSLAMVPVQAHVICAQGIDENDDDVLRLLGLRWSLADLPAGADDDRRETEELEAAVRHRENLPHRSAPE